MASSKFVYTVSGIDLSDAQKAEISHEIAAAVTRVVLGKSAKQVQPQLLSLHGVYGGKIVDTAVEHPTAEFVSSGCQ